MNNEEKILSILEVLTEKVSALDEKVGVMDKRFSTIDERFNAMDKRFNAIDERFDKLEARQTNLEFEVRRTNAIIENEIRPNISLLADGHKGIIERLDRIETAASEFEEVKNTVSALKLAEIKRNKTSNF